MVKIFYIFTLLLSFQVEVLAQDYTVTINSDQMDACPGDPLSFTAVASKHFEKPVTYTWYLMEGEDWVKKGVFNSNSFAVEEMPNNDLYVKVECQEEAKPIVTSDVYEVKLSSSCELKVCHQTTTGEYFGGTDFNLLNGADHIDWTQKPPAGLEEYFSEQDIKFESKDGVIKNQKDLDVNLRIDDSLGVNPNNNFYVKEHVNDDFFTIRFSKEKFNKKNYNFTMRFYLIMPEEDCQIQSSAKLIARTLHGNATQDLMNIRMIDDYSNAIIDSVVVQNGGDAAKYEFGTILREYHQNHKKVGEKNVYRFEMVYYGYLETVNALEYFTFTPRFEQFPDCATLAVDYISAESESVCVTPRSACIDDSITVNAAGFSYDAEYVWKRYTDNTYTQVVPWNMEKNEIVYHTNAMGGKSKVDIKMLSSGTFYYTVENAKSSNEPIRFTLVGRNCIVPGPGIDGSENVCVTEFPFTQTFKARNPETLSWMGDLDVDYTFKWRIESPDKSNSDVTKVSITTAPDKLSATVRVDEGAKMSDAFGKDTSYTVIVDVHKISSGVVSDKSIGSDSMSIWIYDKPNVSTLNFVTLRGEDSICAAYANDTVILQNKEVIEGYQWNFTGATMDANGTIHIDGFEKTALCNSVGASFPIQLDVVNKRCSTTLKDTFYVHSTDAPTIDCSNLSAPTTYELASSQLDTVVYLPIPEYATSCDDDPALNVVISYKGAEAIHNVDSTFVLHKAQLANKENLKFDLYAGKGTVSYNLVDGCGKSASCQIEWAVIDTTAPKINCDEITDYHLTVTKENDCKAVPGSHDGFPELKPKPLRDLNFVDTLIYIEGKYAGRSQINPTEDPGLKPSNYSMSVDLNAPYEKGVTYILWEYSDPSGLTTYCHSSVTVKNEEDPFNCSSLSDIRASVNENKAGLQYHYASAKSQKAPNPDTKYALADLLVVPVPNPKYCGTVKLDILFTGDCVDDNGDVIAVAKDSLISADNFLKHKFPVGLTEVTYRFITDNDTIRNKKDTLECGQKVIIASKDAPQPNDCPKDTTLYVDENCLVTWNITLKDVPTATIPYFKEVKYTYDACSGASYNYQSLGMSAEQSKTYDTLGYPYMVRRISYLDENWKSVAGKTETFECENLLTSADVVPVKEVHHRNPDKSVCAKDPIETMPLKVTNFTELPSCITDAFGKGRHIIVWYYDNGKGVLDSCVTKFTVLDTIPPKKDCGKWGEESLFYCDTTCLVPYQKVGVRVPNVDSLQATDNCTAPEDIVISWTRKFGEETINTFEQDYPLGKTTITWKLTDESGISSYCVQTITVLDTLAPILDCSKLGPITAYADENCEATVDAVVKAGLSLPVIADDPCSPTGDSIKGVGTRYIEVGGVMVKDGKEVFSDAYPKGVTYIHWVFADAQDNKDSCIQVVTVLDTMAPVFPDCGNMLPIVIELDPDSCFASLEYVKKKLGTREAKDNCDGKIMGVPYLTLVDSSYVGLPESFKKDTVYLISWVFTDSENNIKICYQDLEIKDVTPPNPHGVCPDPEKTVPATTECSVDYNALKLPNPIVDDPCDGLLYPKVIARVSQKDGSVIVYQDEELKSARYPVGTHRFVWVYTDNAGLQDSCVMNLTVSDSVALELSDCDVDKQKVVTLPAGQCSLKASELSKYIKFPSAWDLCDEEFVNYRIERRFNGELVVDEDGKPIVWDSQDFPLGQTDIRWIFTDKLGVMKDSCDKSLILKTELFDCNTLQPVVTVDLLENYYATPDEVRAAGLVTPQIEIDTCNAATISFSRSDNLTENDNYQIGKTDVYWTFDYVFGDQKICTQVVQINDMVPPSLICPPLSDVTFECYGEIPTPYQSFEEFQAAGGSISDMKKYKEGTFGYEESDRGAAPCDYHLIRTYFVQDVRDSIISCSQEFIIHDITAPVISTMLDTIVISCDQEIPTADTIVVKATDNCTPDDKIKIELSITNDRSLNPRSCDYNNYKIYRSWTATDSCGNVSRPLVQVVMVVDTTAPKFNLPEDWRDTVLANNIKNCEKDVPVLSDMVKKFISDECTDIEDIKVWQNPSAGTKISEITTVFIYAEDLCGNRDSLSVVVYLDAIKKNVDLKANSLVLCGSDTASINLWSQQVRLAVGEVTIEDMNQITTVPSIFTYDCYRGHISESTLVYSNNKHTYADRFSNPNPVVADSIFKSRVNLRKKDQSDYYYFVAMDTLTQCMDTAVAYLTIYERPRLAMLSDTFYHCENDTLDVDGLFFDHKVCLDDMGMEITKSGWTIGGVDYEAGTPVPFVGKPQQMYYFAENECGRSTTYDSYFTYCGEIPLTKEDSLALVGSENDLKLWRRDELHSKDSIVFIVNQRYKSDSIFFTPVSALPYNSVWVGDEVTFKVSSPYKPAFYMWMEVDGKYDGVHADAFDKYGQRLDSLTTDAEDVLLYLDEVNPKNEFKYVSQDSSLFYVLIGDGVCPAMPSNVYRLNVMDKLPTAFTPFNKDGLNDYFMKGRKVTIFDRYGQRVFDGNDGWDGTTPGGRVDPGVYFYDVQLNTRSFQGSIEVVYMK